MNNRRFSIMTICLIGSILLSACAQATLEPIVIRMTATPQPAAATLPPQPSATSPALPTESVASETQPPAENTSEAPAPTEAPQAVAGEEIRFNWVAPLQTIEQLAPIVDEIMTFDGALAASGNENTITIKYDPAVTSVEALKDYLKQIGHAVEEIE